MPSVEFVKVVTITSGGTISVTESKSLKGTDCPKYKHLCPFAFTKKLQYKRPNSCNSFEGKYNKKVFGLAMVQGINHLYQQ